MKKIFNLTKSKILATLAVLFFIVPAVASAQLNPVLDSVNLYRIANTSNSSAWGTVAEADPGETLTFLVHIHNNVLETTATNVRVQAALPSNAVTSYTSRAVVSADNASPVAGTVNFALSTLSNVEYVPGSTVLYDHNNNLVRTLPDGITTANGIAIGNDIKGCWEFEQWVIFRAKVKAVEQERCNIVARKYEDSNNNGIHDADEAWLEGWTIKISSGGSVITDENGRATFGNLIPGVYNVSEVLTSGWVNTTPLTKAVSCSASTDGYVEFGNRQIPPGEEVPPTTPPTEALPVSGPVEAMAGIFGTIGIGGAGYMYRKSRLRLKNNLKNPK